MIVSKAHFDKLIKLASQPFSPSGKKEASQDSVSRNDKQTRLRKTEGASVKRRGKSR
jgi:hypothetical protein